MKPGDGTERRETRSNAANGFRRRLRFAGLRVRLGLRRLRRNDQILLLGLALGIGLAAALGAIAFREALGLFQWAAFGGSDERLDLIAMTLEWWHLLLAPTLGGLLVGLYLWRFMPGGRPATIPQVMEASALRGGRMSLTTGLHGAVANAASLGVGASAGREGPVVHLGASMGSWVAKRLGLSRTFARTLLACGVAAAVAASFNAPLAGVFFALEVVIGHYALSAFAPIVVSSVVATIVTRSVYGNFPAFQIPEYAIGSMFEFPAFALLGLTAAVVAVAFIRSTLWIEHLHDRIGLPLWLRPAVGGLLVGTIALMVPQILGVGYGPTDTALHGQYEFGMLLALLVAKVAATAITLGSNFGGGVFSPSLFIGAVVGGAFGHVAGGAIPQLFPDYEGNLFSGEGAYALVGMGAVAGAVMGAPISTILIIFELTGDYELTIAVMLSTVIASTVVSEWHGASFFRSVLGGRGVDVEDRAEVDLLRTLRVEGVMSDRFSKIALDAPLRDLRLYLQTAPYSELFVVTPEGRLHGIVTVAEMGEAAYDQALDGLVIAADVARTDPPVLERGDDLATAIRLMEGSNEEHVAVVDDRESRRLIGFVHEKDVMLAYNRALLDLHRKEGAAF